MMSGKYLSDPVVDEEAVEPERCKKANISLLSHTPNGIVSGLPILHLIIYSQGRCSNEFPDCISPIYNFRLLPTSVSVLILRRNSSRAETE